MVYRIDPKDLLSDTKCLEVIGSLVLVIVARMDEEFEDAPPEYELLRTFLAEWVAHKRRLRHATQLPQDPP